MPANSQQLSEQAEISLLTCGPGQELFEAFGHSAIRVHDPESNIDYVFNYGIFEFDQPNFYLNFAKGHLRYKLGVGHYQRFIEEYRYYNRSVYEQVLLLSPTQKQAVFSALMDNSRPENQYYLYDYFFNNCATKIRDVFKDVLGEELQFNDDHIETQYSIRQLIRLYASYDHPWGYLGIDIGLGSRIDERAKPHEYMYLPDYLKEALAHATINIDGQKQSLIKEDKTIFKATPQAIQVSPITPGFVFWTLLILTALLSWRDYKRKKNAIWIDSVLFGLSGLLGIFLLLLWLATDHKSAAWNFNLLWAFPLHLPAVLFLWKRQPPKWIYNYFLACHLFLLLLLAGWTGIPQELNMALLPVALSLGIRSWLIYRHRLKVE